MNAKEFKEFLHSTKVDKYQVMAQLKLLPDYDTFEKVLKPNTSHPIVKKIYFSNPFPKKINEIRIGKKTPYSGILIGELNWFIYSIGFYRKELNTFLTLKAEFDQELLLSNYNEAEKILNEIHDKLGYSFWWLENRLLLSELHYGTEGNWKELSELTKSVEDPFIQFTIDNYSKKAESKISYTRYKNLFINQINELGGFQGVGEYFCFKLNYLGFTGYRDFARYLNLESTSPLIDRYLLIRDLVTEQISKNDKDIVPLLASTVKKLKEFNIKDVWIEQTSSILKVGSVTQFEFSTQFYEILEDYTLGRYEIAIQKSIELIKIQPCILETYEIFCKSFIEAEKDFVKPGISKVVDQILEDLYNVFIKNTKHNTSRDELLKTITAFYASEWSRQLFSVLSRTSRVSDNRLPIRLFFVLYSKVNNPRILTFFNNDQQNFDKIYSSLETISGDTLGLKLNHAIEKGEIESILNDIPESNRRKTFYYGKGLFRIKKYQEAKSAFEEVLNAKTSDLTLEESVYYLIACLIKLKEFSYAVRIYVNYFLRNRNIVSRVPHAKLIAESEKHTSDEIRSMIEFPILVKIGKTDPYEQYIAYDDFMTSLGYQRPTEMMKDQEKFDREKVVFFLSEICNPEILHHSFHFEGTEDIETERVNILHELLKLDKDKEKESVYIKELTEIQQGAKVRKAMHEVNKGRITVNIQELKNSEEPNVKEGFERYLTLNVFTKNKELLSVDTSLSSTIREILNSVSDEQLKRTVYVNDPAFISYKVLFLDLRDKFLLSKEYGLDGYLSTRIRHGSLLNHIRSTFEKFRLISQKDAASNYLDNAYWVEKIPFNISGKLPLIQAELKKFSKNIDEYTETLIKEYIQVKTEKYSKKPKALFDYSYEQTLLAYLFKDARENIFDHRTFLDSVFNTLIEHTKINLKKIQEYFQSNVKYTYLTYLNELQSAIKNICGETSFPDLSSSIVKCSTDIQTELSIISEWFTLSNPSQDLIFDIQTVVQTAVELCNSINPAYHISPKITINSDFALVGNINLIYIMKILLDNIIEHSKVAQLEQEVEIHCEYQEHDFVRITVTNKLPQESDHQPLISKLNEVRENWNRDRHNYENINIEGGSGFAKIRKILALDMLNDDYEFDFKIDESKLKIKIAFPITSKTIVNENKTTTY